MAFTTVTVSGSYELADGTPATGTVTFTPTYTMRNGDVVAARQVVAPITAGALSVELYATDDEGTTPDPVSYRVDERIDGSGSARASRRVYWMQVPAADVTLDIAEAVTVESVPTAITFPIPGPTGPAGPTGATGATGPAGAGPLFVSVESYGAVGDGTTNDYTAILAAVTAVSVRGGGSVWFPAGVYAVAQKLVVPINVYLVGESPYATTLKLTAASPIAIFLEFGATGTINVFGGLKGLQVDSNAKASTGVKMFGPQEGACIDECFVHGSTVTAVDAVGTGIVGGTNMFEIDRSWLWVRGDDGMAGLAISGGLAKITGSTFVGTNRTVDPDAGSAGIVATDANVVIDCVNSEHWEVGYSFTRSYAELRSPETAETDYGIRTSSDSNYPIILSGNAGWNNAIANLDDDGDCIEVTALAVAAKAVRVYASATSQTIATGVQAPINMSATEFNRGGGFTVDLTANTVTCLDECVATIVYEISYQGGGTGQRFAAVQSSLQGQLRLAGTGGVTGDYLASGTAIVELSAGEALSLEGYVDGGSAVTVRSDGVAFTGLAIVQH